MTLDPKTVATFQTKILTWFDQNRRDLPWRKTREPYAILVSEVMLQQTQVPRVIAKYKLWMKTFRDFDRLASAKTSEVLLLWSGLGYNRRAINLQRLAQIVVTSAQLSFLRRPSTLRLRLEEQESTALPKAQPRKIGDQVRNGNALVTLLKKLPGIGNYTAGAVACFAFNQQIAVVDTNIRKVIAIEFFNGDPPDAKTTQQIADQLLPNGRAYEWNQALMDYASAMLARQKVPTPRQSKFVGSNRWYRGQTIKLLVREGSTTIEQLAQRLGDVDQPFLTKIVSELVRDKLVVKHDGTITLPV